MVCCVGVKGINEIDYLLNKVLRCIHFKGWNGSYNSIKILDDENMFKGIGGVPHFLLLKATWILYESLLYKLQASFYRIKKIIFNFWDIRVFIKSFQYKILD